MTWRTLYKKPGVIDKIANAEIRLKAPIGQILQRWVVDEKLPTNHMAQKLDVAIGSVEKLIEHFGLMPQHRVNLEEAKKLPRDRNITHAANTY